MWYLALAVTGPLCLSAVCPSTTTHNLAWDTFFVSSMTELIPPPSPNLWVQVDTHTQEVGLIRSPQVWGEGWFDR